MPAGLGINCEADLYFNGICWRLSAALLDGGDDWQRTYRRVVGWFDFGAA